MKLNFLPAGLWTCLLFAVVRADAQESPAAIAAREELEANYKHVSTKVERLEETFEAQQKAMTTLLKEIDSLRDEIRQLKGRNENAATQESIKKLAEKIEEVDRKRQADNELVLSRLSAAIKGLNKPLKDNPPPSTTEKSAPPAREVPSENLLAYKIKDGDTLVRIVADLRAQGFKVTQKQIMDVNPAVNWSKLRIGQTVFIPKPTP